MTFQQVSVVEFVQIPHAETIWNRQVPASFSRIEISKLQCTTFLNFSKFDFYEVHEHIIDFKKCDTSFVSDMSFLLSVCSSFLFVGSSTWNTFRTCKILRASCFCQTHIQVLVIFFSLWKEGGDRFVFKHVADKVICQHVFFYLMSYNNLCKKRYLKIGIK